MTVSSAFVDKRFSIESVEREDRRVCDFILNLRKIGKEVSTLKEWLREWVLSVDHDKYLGKLGTERLMSLIGSRNPDSWRTEIKNKLSEISLDEPCNAVERES